MNAFPDTIRIRGRGASARYATSSHTRRPVDIETTTITKERQRLKKRRHQATTSPTKCTTSFQNRRAVARLLGPARAQARHLVYYIKRKLPRISHFLHTEFGSKVIARRLGPRRGPTRVFSNRNCARPAVSRCRVPCDMWPKTPWQHCVAVFSRNPIPAIIAALTFYHSFEPPPSWSSLPPIFWPPSDA